MAQADDPVEVFGLDKAYGEQQGSWRVLTTALLLRLICHSLLN